LKPNLELLNLIGYDQTKCFALESYQVKKHFKLLQDETFYVLVVVGGKGQLKTNAGVLNVAMGDQFFVSAQTEAIECSALDQLEGLTLLKCRPPNSKSS
jgi:mannose-6-phosphate isomerase class I